MTRVFISYRRGDTGPEAGRLADALQQRLGKGAVFRDLAAIHPGDDFETALAEALGQCRQALVLIGPGWVAEVQRRAAESEKDFVHMEVAAALGRQVWVIPVLLREAAVPRAEDLPPDLAALARRQVFRLRDEAWEADVDRLVAALGRPYRWALLAVRAGAALALSVLAVRFALPEASIGEGRLILGGLLLAYGAGEGAWAWRSRRGGRD